MTAIFGNRYSERAITILTLLGLLTTIHLWIMSERGFDRGCLGFSTNPQFEEMFDCEAVSRSDLSHPMGIANVYWGMMFYALLTVLNFLVYSVAGNRQKPIRILRLVFITIGFGYSILLQIHSYTWVHEFCALCVASAVICSLLFAISMVYWRKHPLTLTVPDVHSRFFTSALMIVMFIGMGDILYFNSVALEVESNTNANIHYRTHY